MCLLKQELSDGITLRGPRFGVAGRRCAPPHRSAGTPHRIRLGEPRRARNRKFSMECCPSMSAVPVAKVSSYRFTHITACWDEFKWTATAKRCGGDREVGCLGLGHSPAHIPADIMLQIMYLVTVCLVLDRLRGKRSGFYGVTSTHVDYALKILTVRFLHCLCHFVTDKRINSRDQYRVPNLT